MDAQNRYRVVIRSEGGIPQTAINSRSRFAQPIQLRDIMSLDGIEFINLECSFVSPISFSPAITSKALTVSVREFQGYNTYDTAKKGPSSIVAVLEDRNSGLLYGFQNTIGSIQISKELLNSHMLEIVLESSDSTVTAELVPTSNWLMVLNFWW